MVDEQPTLQAPPAAPPAPPKKKTWVIVLAVIGGIVVAAWVFNAVSSLGAAAVGWEEKGTVAIDEDRYVSFAFEATSGIVNLDANIMVNSGPNVEVIVMDQLNFQNFQDGASYVHQSQCGRAPINSAEWSCSLSAGVWYVVIDNTDQGDTAPPFNAVNDTAVVQYSFSAS